MYFVKIGNDILYYPASSDAVIYDTELNEEVGKAGEFSFKVPPQNPHYASLAKGAIITVYKDGEECWRGDIQEVSVDFQKVANVYCLEDLAWLGLETLPPALITTETYAQRLTAALDAYNLYRNAERQFTVGYITNVNSSDTCEWTTEYGWSILDDLRANIARDNGYLKVRRVTSGGVVTRHIDIVRLVDYGVLTTQPIEYGYNLLDYVKNSDYSELVNVLTPLGAETETELYEDYMERLEGTTIQEATSITAYGRHAKAVVFDEVTDLPTLNALAEAYLAKYCQPQLTMEVKAVDLAAIENVADIKIGDSVRIIAPPFAVDQWLYLTQIKRDIQNVDKNTITLSGSVPRAITITSQTIDASKMLDNLPSKASILDAARKNAYEILTGTEGGYVTFEVNSDGQIVELRVANNLDMDQATKAWIWNLGGLGFMSRDSASDPWGVITAMTMDGAIVADFITTGTMLADRIRGGSLILGGFDNINGVEILQDANGVEKIRLDKDGVKVGTSSGSKMVLTDGELQLFFDNVYAGALAMVATNYGTELNPNIKDAVGFRGFDAIQLYTDDSKAYVDMWNDGNDGFMELKAKTVGLSGDLSITGKLTFDNIETRSGYSGDTGIFSVVNYKGELVDVSVEQGVIYDIDETGTMFDGWHTWSVGGVTYSFIQLTTGNTTATFPQIDDNLAYYPYIECAKGVSPPQITDMKITASNECVVTFTAVTSAQAAGSACKIKLRAVGG